jgi:hypothetical protein
MVDQGTSRSASRIVGASRVVKMKPTKLLLDAVLVRLAQFLVLSVPWLRAYATAKTA